MNNKTVQILLLEDDEVDTIAVKRAFANLRIVNPLHCARDGVEGLAMLSGTDGYDAVPSPYLIILDINMPRMNGIEFLTNLRSDPLHRRAIVFVLTTSNADRDRIAAYDNNVAGYILKSRFEDDFVEVVRFIDTYWRIIEFP